MQINTNLRQAVLALLLLSPVVSSAQPDVKLHCEVIEGSDLKAYDPELIGVIGRYSVIHTTSKSNVHIIGMDGQERISVEPHLKAGKNRLRGVKWFVANDNLYSIQYSTLPKGQGRALYLSEYDVVSKTLKEPKHVGTVGRLTVKGNKYFDIIHSEDFRSFALLISQRSEDENIKADHSVLVFDAEGKKVNQLVFPGSETGEDFFVKDRYLSNHLNLLLGGRKNSRDPQGRLGLEAVNKYRVVLVSRSGALVDKVVELPGANEVFQMLPRSIDSNSMLILGTHKKVSDATMGTFTCHLDMGSGELEDIDFVKHDGASLQFPSMRGERIKHETGELFQTARRMPDGGILAFSMDKEVSEQGAVDNRSYWTQLKSVGMYRFSRDGELMSSQTLLYSLAIPSRYIGQPFEVVLDDNEVHLLRYDYIPRTISADDYGISSSELGRTKALLVHSYPIEGKGMVKGYCSLPALARDPSGNEYVTGFAIYGGAMIQMPSSKFIFLANQEGQTTRPGMSNAEYRLVEMSLQ